MREWDIICRINTSAALWMIQDKGLNGNHESHEAVRCLSSWSYWSAISQSESEIMAIWWPMSQWQSGIVCAHHNQWQDKMIQITSWNCEIVFLLRFCNDTVKTLWMHFRFQRPEDFQSSENEWNFELQLTLILFTYNYRTLYFHNWSFSAVNSFSL